MPEHPNMRMYRTATKTGWKPLSDRRLETWEKRILIKSLRPVLTNGIGYGRKDEGTKEAITAIAPVVALSVAEKVAPDLPKEESEAFSQLMRAYSKNLQWAWGESPEEAKRLRSGISPQSFYKITQTIHPLAYEEGKKFHFATDEKYGGIPSGAKGIDIFKQDVDFQLRHDISHSVKELQHFLSKLY